MAMNMQLVFRGEVLVGFQPDKVRRDVATVLQLDEVRTTQLFSGVRVVLKRSVEAELARRYAAKLAQIGARIHLEPADAPPTTGFAPLPDLPEVPDASQPAPPPWGMPPRPTRPAPLTPLAPPAPAPIPVATAPAPLATEPVATITCPNCGERQSKRVLCRNCSTNIETALAAKEEERQRARGERLGAAALRERSSTVPRATSDTPALFGLNFDGRLGRVRAGTGNLILMGAFLALDLMLVQRQTLGGLVLYLVLTLVLLVPSFRLCALRFHDLDRSGWWCLLLLVPFVNLVIALMLMFVPGSDDANEFGPRPEPGNWFAFGAAAIVAAALFAKWLPTMMAAVETARQKAGAAMPAAAGNGGADPRLGAAAQAAFVQQYMSAATHKAFALSPAGAWGMAAGRASPLDAVRDALLDGESRRPSYTADRQIFSIDGRHSVPR